MYSNKRTKSADKFLKNESFVLWCLDSTPQLDAFWTDYIDNNPAEAKDIAYARNILRFVRLNDKADTAQRSDMLWSRIELSMKESDLYSGKNAFVRYSVAVLSVLLIVAGVWTGSHFFQKADNNVAETEVVAKTNETVASTEVVLIRDNQEVLEIENNAVIEYDNDITIQTEKDKKVISKKKSDTVKKNKLIVPYGRR